MSSILTVQKNMRFTPKHDAALSRALERMQRDPSTIPPWLAPYLTEGRELSGSEIAGALCEYLDAAMIELERPPKQ